MKKYAFLFVCILTLVLSIKWIRDARPKEDIDDSSDDFIQFYNQNTGWFSSSVNRDTIFKTSNGGLNWTGYLTVDTNRLTTHFFVDQNTGWAVGRRGKIVKTTTGGISWFLQTSGVQSWLNDVKFIDALTGFVVGSYDSSRVILKTTTGGANWINLSSNGTGRLFSIKMLSANTAYAAGDSGRILFTSNGGSSWSTQITNVSSTLREIVMRTSSFGCAVGLNGIILTTTNGGTTWVNHSFSNINFYSADFGSNDTGYIGGQYGRIYKTTNAGFNWFRQQTPVDTTKNIKSIFCMNNQNAWASAKGDILIYTTNGGVVGISNISSEIPLQYILSQNYPNPFNPSTKIRFAIPKQNFVKLTIYDVTGRVMAILVNEELKTGTYEVDWDASHRASGIYYYKLEADGFAETKKMVLLK